MNQFKIIIIIATIVAGSIITLATKYQNSKLVYQGSYYKYFFHPFLQTGLMFLGESFALIIFFYQKKINPQIYHQRTLEAIGSGKKVDCTKFIIAISSFLDLLTSSLEYIALNFVAGSVSQIMIGGSIITTFIFTKFLLKSKINKNQTIGSMLALIGITIVGLSNLIFSQEQSINKTFILIIVGYFLIVLSLFTGGLYYTFHERLFSKYYFEPVQVVGYQGIFGLFFSAILIPILSSLHCPFGINACVFNQQSIPFFQKPQIFLQQIFSNWDMIICTLILVFTITVSNICGISITKHINALARSVADVGQTIGTWTIGLIVTIIFGKQYPNYSWEITNWKTIVLELFGLVMVVIGNLVYHQTINLQIIKQHQYNRINEIEKEQFIN